MAEEGEFMPSYAREGEPESRLFAELRSCSLEVLEFVKKPKKHSPALSRLLNLLRSSSPDSLECFFDYALFPLLLLFDAAVGCRSSAKEDYKEKSAVSNKAKLPYSVSDSVAESVVKCLEELLKKSRLSSVDQMTVLLKKLACGAMLPTSESAEEFREGIIRCFRMLVLNLHQCSDESCSCRMSLFRPVLSNGSDLVSSTDTLWKYQSQPKECLLSYLQSESASAAVGHWLSLLLNAADAEVAKGHKGSASLRIEAFVTLRVLVAKVGTADALAFFLPGVVIQLGKVLHISKSMISGAAGSSEATEHAIRGLAEYLMVVLHDDANHFNLPTSFFPNDKGSPESFLKEINNLRDKVNFQSDTPTDSSISGGTADVLYKDETISGGKQSLHIERSKDWFERTSAQVNKLLGFVFPKLCLHPSKRVRRGLVASTYGLLQNCSHTLKDSRIMFLECLCTLVCDDSEEVLLAAQESLKTLFFSSKKQIIEHDVAEILSRLIDKVPKAVLGNDESLALAYAQQMLGILYFSGPQLVINHLLCSPIKAGLLLDVFNVCLSQESAFAGSLDKVFHSRPSGNRYLHAIAELKFSGKTVSDEQRDMNSSPSRICNKIAQVKDIIIKGTPCADYELPCMPSWFPSVGSQKLYLALAGILRLISLSLVTSHRSEISLSSIVEIPLCHLRMLVNEIRMRQYGGETWQSWYVRTGSGKLLRQASTAVCILNEMIFGLSDKSLESFSKIFHKSRTKLDAATDDVCPWEAWSDSARNQLIDCVGLILHEYISPEIWDLPMEHKISYLEDGEAGATTENLFQDVAMLQKVIVDGIGIFNLCLGEDFVSSGFLRSSFYLLLENIVCSDFDVRHASDAVLHIISSKSGYSTVGQLVMANSDYVIDSLCRQLRHLDSNPHIPNVLAAMLSYIGLANAILPLLEEPMRSVSLELEILCRHRHPELTISFLKAVAEIAKAAKQEASLLPSQAESYASQVAAKLSDIKKKVKRSRQQCEEDINIAKAFDEIDTSSEPSDGEVVYCSDDVDAEEWENILLHVNDKRRYRRIVASIASSCLTAVTPLLSSAKEKECLVSLDIIEYGVTTLSFVEAAYKFEKESKEAVKEVAESCSFFHLVDTLDAADEGTDENRLRPAVNKIWPFLVACVRNRNPLSIRRCTSVISSVVRTTGGDFFPRRFHSDGHHFWKLLTTSPFNHNKTAPKQETPHLLLPYRATSLTSQPPFSESSTLKLQAAILNMIADISRDKRSASALEAVLKKISGLVVAIACSGVTGLQEASINALSGLAEVDADLIWLLLADVYYSEKKKMGNKPAPPSSEFPDLPEILPPLSSSSKDYLYVLYGGQTFGFDINFSSVETVFRRLSPESFIPSLQG